MMKAPTYTFINHINIPTPSSHPSSHDKISNAVFDDDDPTNTVVTSSTNGDDRSVSIEDDNTSYHQSPSEDKDENSTFEDDDPSTGPRSYSSSSIEYNDNNSYESEELR